MTLPADLRGALLLGGAFFVVLAAAETWRRLGNPRPEWTRKMIHLAGGGVCLFFPLLIESPWVVLAMALGLSGLFTLAAASGFLKSLHGVTRSSRGAEYYPLAIWTVFLLCADRYWLYLSSVLVLAVADALAALVGSRFGRHRYEVEEEQKSLEGSLVFLLVAFSAIYLSMLLLADLPGVVCLFAALLVAILVTGFEAISLRGTDNLFVPIAVVVVLTKITAKPPAEIVAQNISLVLIIFCVALLVWYLPLFNVGGTIVLILYGYGAWSLGSWQWALPIFSGLLSYVLAWTFLAPRREGSRLRVRGVARALLVPFMILAVANGTDGYASLFGPYVMASAVVLTGSVAKPLFALAEVRAGKTISGVLLISLLGSAVIALPPWLFQSATSISSLLVVPAVLFPATLLMVLLEGDGPNPRIRSWTASRIFVSLLAAGAIYAVQAMNLVPHWSPV